MAKTVLLIGAADVEVGLTASYKRAFELLGFNVVPFDLDAERDRVSPPGRLGRRLMSHLDFFALNAKANRHLARVATELQPDMLVAICNQYLRTGTLLQIKVDVPGIKVINIYPDPLHNMHDYVLTAL